MNLQLELAGQLQNSNIDEVVVLEVVLEVQVLVRVLQ